MARTSRREYRKWWRQANREAGELIQAQAVLRKRLEEAHEVGRRWSARCGELSVAVCDLAGVRDPEDAERLDVEKALGVLRERMEEGQRWYEMHEALAHKLRCLADPEDKQRLNPEGNLKVLRERMEAEASGVVACRRALEALRLSHVGAKGAEDLLSMISEARKWLYGGSSALFPAHDGTSPASSPDAAVSAAVGQEMAATARLLVLDATATELRTALEAHAREIEKRDRAIEIADGDARVYQARLRAVQDAAGGRLGEKLAGCEGVVDRWDRGKLVASVAMATIGEILGVEKAAAAVAEGGGDAH